VTSRLVVGQSYEANPYPASVPRSIASVSADLYGFLRQLVEPLREQHDSAQAGDSSFPWDLLNQNTAQQQYHLGSQGRFVHPDYGLIQARYCQFLNPNGVAWTGSPVGYVKGMDFSWKVSNDLAQSAIKLVTGVQAAYETALNNHYGWIIQRGVNTQTLQFHGASAPPDGTKLSWYGTGLAEAGASDFFATVIHGASAISLGGSLWELPPATVLIGRE
jgi:hypothetical protein